MKHISVALLLFILLSALSPAHAINACTGGPKQPGELNIVTYNIGDDQKVCEKCPPEQRMQALMNIFTAKDTDIIDLQELWIRKSGKIDFIEDAKALFPLLEAGGYSYIFRGHQDDSLTTKGIPNQGSNYGNSIITKFPILKETYKEYFLDKKIGDGQAQRYYISVVVQTPSGKVRIFNIHTRYAESEWGGTEAAKFISEVIRTEPGMPYIILGDFNQQVQYVRSQLSTAYSIPINYNCAEAGSCFSGGVDLILSDPSIIIQNRCQGTSTWENMQISGGHVPVYATFRFAKPTVRGDLDANGVIDIFDYNVFLGVFGQTGTPGFHAADIIKNGVIDIFDYNELLKALAGS